MIKLYALGSLLGLLVLAQVADANGAAGSECRVNGYTFASGENFTIPGNSPCVSYLCTDGHASLLKGGCLWSDTCVDVNNVYVDDCITYTCTLIGTGSYHIGPTLAQCLSEDGNCYNLGDVFPLKIGDTTYDSCTCYQEGSTIKYRCGSPGAGAPAAPEGSCTVNGATYANNEVFNIPGHPACILYECVDGKYSLKEEGCSVDGHCRGVGEEFEWRCSIWRCDKETVDEIITYKTTMITPRCKDNNDMCFELGELFSVDYGGETYDKCTCSAQGTNITYHCGTAVPGTSASCRVNGEVFLHDEMITYPNQSICLVFKCNNGQREVIQEGCEVAGLCHDINSVFEHDCFTYTCAKKQNGTSIRYLSEIVDSGCADAHDQCHPPGELFPLYIEDQLYEQCTCSITGRKISYSCSGGPAKTTDECEVEGVMFNDGEEFSIPNGSPCNLYLCNKGSYAPTQIACQNGNECHPVNSTFIRKCDEVTCLLKEINGSKFLTTETDKRRCMDADGNCLDLGSKNFPYEVDGIRHEDCSCTLLENRTIHYICKVSGANGGACKLKGKVYANGEVFTLPDYPCNRFMCVDGNASHIVEEGCEVDGGCQPLGQTYIHDCATLVCEKTIEDYKPIYRSKLVEKRCTDDHGNCHLEGAHFDHRIMGVLYANCTCSVQSGWITYSCARTKCYVEGEVFEHGERFSLARQSQCVMYLCWHGGWSLCKEGCDVDGQCVNVGQTFSDGCSTRKCIRTETGGHFYYNTDLVKSRCTDADGNCHEVGSRFPYEIEGVRRLSCTCSVKGNSLDYTCDEEA